MQDKALCVANFRTIDLQRRTLCGLNLQQQKCVLALKWRFM